MPIFSRVIVIVLDSVGIGELPDAPAYGDEGSNTLGNIAARAPLKIPALRSLGIEYLVTLDTRSANLKGSRVPVIGAYGRMAEASPGKDSVTGHWEMMGIVLDRPFPTFPHGFPADVIAEFERRIGRGTLGNVVASGTEIIDRLGPEHMRTAKPIVYTSADSVFQIAAHEEVIPVSEQYGICETAFDLVARGMGVGRVIARPFVGAPGSFKRTANRHDYALDPTEETLLDRLTRHGVPVVAIGKINDLFAGRGIGRAIHTASDAEGMERLSETMRGQEGGFIFVNLVDFDTVYGHRNDVEGYASNLERFDEALVRLLPNLRPSDLLVVTADHGNDPSTPSTDHSREFVPVLITGGPGGPAEAAPYIRRGVDIGTRQTFADLGQTLAENFGVGPLAHGTSFLEDIVVHHP
ncbi:MAG TPA: phosphopentomutase [Vicinamibacterales bacterium]|nr:phosphopentomutase [Vicinamibacterales bacterium]